MRVQRLELGALQTNCWVVADDAGGPAIVIDPGDEGRLVLEALADLPVAAVVLTHAHFDHLGGVSEVVAATGAPLLVHESDAHRLTSDAPEGTGGALFGFHGMVAPHADRTLRDGDVVQAGALDLEVLHTPGHTAGGICLFTLDDVDGTPHLFSGDTLFAGSVGRTDFPGGDTRELSASIASKLSGLPQSTVVHPGHGPDTTIAREARINPFWPRA